MSNLSSSGLAKLSVWKQSLRNKKAGLPLDPPYDTVRPYEAWSPEGRLVYDALLNVLEALTEEKK